MIILLTGENDFMVRQALTELIRTVGDDIERYDGEDLNVDDLASISSGMTLFSTKRTIVIRNLSVNSALWNEAPRFFERIDDATMLIIVEPEIDKRTKTYKWLRANAQVTESHMWSIRDQAAVEAWTREQAKKMDLVVKDDDLKRVIARTGFNQGKIYAALEKLALADIISGEVIDQTVEITTDDSVFDLFEAALSGQKDYLQHLIDNLSREVDAYQVVGVLASQSLQLAALALGGKSTSEIATATGFHPFSLSKLSKYARLLGPKKARQIIKDVTDTDSLMKTVAADPWASVEALLYKIALVSS